VSLLLLLCICCLSVISAEQWMCDVGSSSYPCPDIRSQVDQWGIGIRVYEEIGYAQVSAPSTIHSVWPAINSQYELLSQYLTPSGNTAHVNISRLVPIGVEGVNVSSNWEYRVTFFLPDAVLSDLPQPVNTSIAVATAAAGSVSPYLLAITVEPTESVILSRLAELDAILTRHSVKFDPTVFAFVSYNTAKDPTPYWSEVWRWQSSTDNTPQQKIHSPAFSQSNTNKHGRNFRNKIRGHLFS